MSQTRLPHPAFQSAAKYAHRLCGSKMLARLTQSHSSAPSLGFLPRQIEGHPQPLGLERTVMKFLRDTDDNFIF